MDTAEYMAFVPLLIFGIALAELLGQWKRLFDLERLYWPYVLMTLMLTENGVYNVFIYLKLVDKMESLSYFGYLGFLLPPFLFMLTVNAFTPDEGADTETYFKGRLRMFFFLSTLFILSHFLYDYDLSRQSNIGRIVAILLFSGGAAFRKVWMVHVLFALWLVTFVVRGNITVA